MRRVLALLTSLLLSTAALADEALWSLLKAGGQVVLVRHAQTTAGVGDPPGMKLDDCATQRNLDEQGRADAVALGESLRARGVAVGPLLSSPWCRCLETARLAFRREASVDTALSNLFGRRDKEAAQVAQLRKLVGRPAAGGNTVMLTHGSTIYALTGVSPSPGELVIVTPQPGGAFKVAGRLLPSAAAPGRPTSARP